MLIGEQPGNEEDKQGKAFVGPAGQRMDRLLAEAGGVDRKKVYVANAVKHSPRHFLGRTFRVTQHRGEFLELSLAPLVMAHRPSDPPSREPPMKKPAISRKGEFVRDMSRIPKLGKSIDSRRFDKTAARHYSVCRKANKKRKMSRISTAGSFPNSPEFARGLGGFRHHVPTQLLSIGISELDTLLAGGVLRGSLVELCGSASPGRTSICFSLLAAATKRQEACAYVMSLILLTPCLSLQQESI